MNAGRLSCRSASRGSASLRVRVQSDCGLLQLKAAPQQTGSSSAQECAAANRLLRRKSAVELFVPCVRVHRSNSKAEVQEG